MRRACGSLFGMRYIVENSTLFSAVNFTHVRAKPHPSRIAGRKLSHHWKCPGCCVSTFSIKSPSPPISGWARVRITASSVMVITSSICTKSLASTANAPPA